MASVSWLTLWRNVITLPVKTATHWAVSSVRPRPAMKTTSSQTTSARASAPMNRSGWASMTWWPKALGWTRLSPASLTKIGTHPTTGTPSQMAASPRTVPSCLCPPRGSGLMRTVVKRSRPSVGLTSFDRRLSLLLSVCALSAKPLCLLF